MKIIAPLLLLAASAFAAKPIYVAPVPPPPALEEKHPLAKPGEVWIDGFWAWENDRHVWHAGHWEKPPKANARYIAPHWDRKGDHYVFYEGRWK